MYFYFFHIIILLVQNSKITATSSGHGYLVTCDDDGLVHLISRTFHVTTFRAYQSAVLLSTQLQYNSFLVTIGVNIFYMYSFLVFLYSIIIYTNIFYFI